MISIKQKISLYFEDSLLRNASYLISDGILGTALGFIYWAIITRYYEPSDVGISSATISAISFIVAISGQGIQAGLIRFLPLNLKESNKTINLCLTLNIIILCPLIICYYILLPYWSDSLLIFVNENLILFIYAIFAFSLSNILDSAIIASRKTQYLITKNLQLNILKIILVVALASSAINGVFYSWGLATVIICIIQAIYIVPKVNKSYKPKPIVDLSFGKEIIEYSIKTNFSDFLAGLPSLIIPVIVLEVLNAENAAYFSISWMIFNSLLIVSKSTTLSLFTEGSNNRSGLNCMIYKTIKYTFIQIMPIIIIMVLLGKQILLIFGQEYAINGYLLLVILLISLIPYSINTTYFTILRIEKQLGKLTTCSSIIATSIIILSYISIQKYGLIGFGFGWTIPHIFCTMYTISKLKYYIKSDKQ